MSEHIIETKQDSYGELMYRVKPPKRGIPIGWFKSEEEAIEAYNKYQSGNS